jgi:hypothetical protein
VALATIPAPEAKAPDAVFPPRLPHPTEQFSGRGQAVRQDQAMILATTPAPTSVAVVRDGLFARIKR